MTGRREIEAAAKAAGPWTDEAAAAIKFLRELDARASLTDAERFSFRVLRQREINESVRLRNRCGAIEEKKVFAPHQIAMFNRRDRLEPWPNPAEPWVYDDGGRAEHGFVGDADDCVCRAVAIATGKPYGDVYAELAELVAASGGPRSARNGISKKITRAYITGLGWKWWPTMEIGSGCQVHLEANELPGGRLIVSVSKHICAVVDGVVRDTFDPRRDGTRCVYGYFTPEGS